MLRVFDQIDTGQEAAKLLLSLRQGRGTVADYAISFRTLAADSGWNEPALVSAFLNGLSEPLKDGLASIDCPDNLETLISHAIRLDNRLRERNRNRVSFPVTPDAPLSLGQQPTSSSMDPEPMQVGRTRLSQAEKD